MFFLEILSFQYLPLRAFLLKFATIINGHRMDISQVSAMLFFGNGLLPACHCFHLL